MRPSPTLVPLLLALAGLACAVDQTPYKPSGRVQQYHAYDFDKTTSYLQKVVTRVAPIFIIGFILFVLFLFWSCCRCCRCCSCRPYRQSQCTRSKTNAMLVIIILISLACVGMLIYGFKADESQSNAIQSVPSLVDNVVNWKNNATATVNVLLTSLSNMQTSINAFLANTTICGLGGAVNCNSLTAALAPIASASSQGQSILSNVGSMSLDRIRSSLSNSADTADKYRHIAMIAIISAMFGIILLQGLVSLLNACAPVRYQPRKVCLCKPVTYSITALMLIFILIMWILASLLLAISTLFADFCITPETNIISTTGLSDQYSTYYIKCGNDPSLVNPFAASLNSINNSYTAINTNINDFRTQVNACSNQYCSQGQYALSILSTQVISIQSAIGYTDAKGNPISGIIGILSCASLNGLIQAVLHVVCDDFFISVSITFEVFMAFACLMVIMEFFKRKVPVKDEDADSFTKTPSQVYGQEMGPRGSSASVAPNDSDTMKTSYMDDNEKA